MKQDRLFEGLITVLAIWLVLFVFGCSIQPAPATSNLVPTATISNTPDFHSNTPTVRSWTMTPTMLPTKIPISSTPSPSPSSNITQPSLTPASTLAPAEVRAEILGKLENNGGCRLPCLWGVTPGTTEGQAVRLSLAQFGKHSTRSIYVDQIDFETTGALIYDSIKENLTVQIGFSYYINNDTVERLGLTAFSRRNQPVEEIFGDPYFNSLLQYYRLPQILSNYGRPSNVLIATWLYDPTARAKWNPFSIVLDYRGQGFLVEYLAPLKIQGNLYLGCPSQAHVTIWTWDLERKFTLEEIVSKDSGAGINELNTSRFKSVDEATSQTLDQFYEHYKDPNSKTCLETSSNLWQP